jgi:small subunit ribosomal protein S20
MEMLLMPTIESAEKRVRQNKKRRRRNRSWKSQVKNDRQALEDAIEDDADEDEIRERLSEAISSIDRAVSKGVYHENKGGRLKSQIQRKVNEALDS